MRFLLASAVLLFSILRLSAEDERPGFLPASVEAGDFAILTGGQSPFSRALNLSDSLILTGIATLDEERVATLMNKETKETFVVSSTLNSQGWKMVELKEDGDLEKVAAKVAVDGGEVVTVRYSEWQLKPGESKPGAGPSEGGRSSEGMRGRFGKGKGDGFRGPPPEFREKMSRLSEEQRTKLFEKMRAFREKNPDTPREDMGRMMMQTMDKMLESR